MNNTDDSLRNRRVPFIYHTLLYKLDNIHLKLKCQRKKHIPTPSDIRNESDIQGLLGGTVFEVLKVSNIPVDCGVSSVNQETRYGEKVTGISGDKVSHERDNIFSNGDIGNDILYDSESDTASDLSIDGCHESYNHLSKSISQKEISHSDNVARDCHIGPAGSNQEHVTLYDIDNKSNISEECELEKGRPYSNGDDEILLVHDEKETEERKIKALRKNENKLDLNFEAKRSLELMNTVHKSYPENDTDDIENDKPYQREIVLKTKIENNACLNELNGCGDSLSKVSPTSAEEFESTNCPADKPAKVDDKIKVVYSLKFSGDNSIKEYNRGSSSLLIDDTLLSNNSEVQQTKLSSMTSRSSQSNKSISEVEPSNAGILKTNTELDEKVYPLKNNKGYTVNDDISHSTHVKTGMATCDEPGKSSNSQSGSASQNLKFKEHGTCSNKLLKNSLVGRQNGLFVKEFDNSFSLISDLLTIGSSSKRRESAESLRKDRTQMISTSKTCHDEQYGQETSVVTGKLSRLHMSDASFNKFDREDEKQSSLDIEKPCIPVIEKQFVIENKRYYTSDNKNEQTLNNEHQILDNKRQDKSDNGKDSLDKTLTKSDNGKSKTNYKRNHFFASSLPGIIKASGIDKTDWNLSMDEKRPRNYLQKTNDSIQKSNEIDCYNSLVSKLEHISKLSKKMTDEKAKLDTRSRECIKEFTETRNGTSSISDSIGRDNEEDKTNTKTENESTRPLGNGAINTHKQIDNCDTCSIISQKYTSSQEKVTDLSTEYQDKLHNALPIDKASISQTEEKNTDKTEIAKKSQKGLNRSFKKSQTPKSNLELDDRIIDEIDVQPFRGKDDGIIQKVKKQTEDYIQTKTPKVDERITQPQSVKDTERSKNENPTENRTTMNANPDELPSDDTMSDIQQNTIIETDKETISGFGKKTAQGEKDLEIISTSPEKSITTETITAPIIIKRLERPDISKSEKKDKKREQGKEPYVSFPFKVIPSSSLGSKYFEDFSPKVIAESLANLPMMGGKDVQLPCPTCQQNVFSDGKIVKSDCMDPVHQMLMQIPSLQSIAEKHGLVVRNIAGDGNCMFHAVIDQLRIAGDFTFNKDTLRSKSVEYLRENPCQEDGSHLMCFLSTESWEEYLIRMNRDGEWGDHMILNAITEVIGRTVTVLNNSESVTHLFPHTATLSDEVTLDSVYLGHVGMHYVSLRPKDWEKTWAMNAKIRRMSKYLEQRQEVPDVSKDSAVGALIDVEGLQYGQLFEGKTDLLDSLIKDVDFVEPVSRVPVMHLSFIVKKMLRFDFFSHPHQHPLTVGDDSKTKIVEIGSTQLGLNVRLVNFTQSMREQVKDLTDICTPEYILIPSESYYKVVDNEREMPIFNEDAQQHYLVIDTDQTHPGYCRLKAKVPIKYSGDSKGGLITKCLSGKWFIYRVPAKLLKSDTIKTDYVGGFDYEDWPFEAYHWKNRDRSAEWPRREIVEKVCKSGCYIRHKSHPGSFEKEVEFQYIFTKAEDILVNEDMTEDMRYCFYVFKALMKFQTKNIGFRLPNYLMTTVLLYACESIPADTWRNSCGGCVLYMINLFHSWFRQHYFPHYFIKQNNMIDHWNKREVDQLCESTESLRLFPCMVIHFICENYGMGTWTWIIDSVMASSKKFKDDKDACWVVENVFNPTTFYYLGHYVTNPKDREFVFLQLTEAFEQNLIWTGTSFDFKVLVDEFLLTVESGKTRKTFTDFVEKELNNNTKYITFADFLGPDYNGKYGKHRLKSSSKPVEQIEDFVFSLLIKGDFEQITHIVRCLISETRKSFETATVDVGDIEDTELKSQIVKSNLKQTTKYLSKLQKYYWMMGICFTKMDKVQLFQEFILEYEEVIEQMPKKQSVGHLSSMWKKLNNPEKAREAERKLECLLEEEEEEDHEFSRNLMKLLIKHSS
ncbi:uncharacterized protein LOC143079039 [Mytilus galloprovincialis]|uniref:uncharacterized protein LOC143079039 n=1 Tax=Mytilus galloprovincialis TaxID=29158 RepID=UPI003F7C4A66